MWVHRSKGFSTLEQLLVVLTVGTTMTFSMPQMTRIVEMFRRAEAYTTLGSLRTAQVAHHLEYGTYTKDPRRLVIAIPSDDSRSHYYRYTIASADRSGFVLRAIRKTGNDVGKEPNYRESYVVTLNLQGLFQGSP